MLPVAREPAFMEAFSTGKSETVVAVPFVVAPPVPEVPEGRRKLLGQMLSVAWLPCVLRA